MPAVERKHIKTEMRAMW